eukprot:scaffold6705_cov134-Isochrysis_galbana.AAC.3
MEPVPSAVDRARALVDLRASRPSSSTWLMVSSMMPPRASTSTRTTLFFLFHCSHYVQQQTRTAEDTPGSQEEAPARGEKESFEKARRGSLSVKRALHEKPVWMRR